MAEADGDAPKLGLHVRLDTYETSLLGLVFHQCSPGKVRLNSDNLSEEAKTFDVELTRPFAIAKTLVTQAMWSTVMGTTPWLDGDGSGVCEVRTGSDYPAVWVDWNQANEFCAVVSKKCGIAAALPSEAQWECHQVTPLDTCVGDT